MTPPEIGAEDRERAAEMERQWAAMQAGAGDRAKGLAYLDEGIGIALEKGLSKASIVDHLIEAAKPVPADEVREIIDQRFAEAEAAAERQRVEAEEAAAADHARLMAIPAEELARMAAEEAERKRKAERERKIDRQCSQYHPTDVGNGQRFAARFGDSARYCHPRKSWYQWDGTRWAGDRGNTIRQMAKVTARAIYRETSYIVEDDRGRKQLGDWAIRSEGEQRLSAILSMAGTEPGINTLPEEFDTDGNLFNVENGTFNLTTLELQPHRREDLITKMAGTGYHKDAPCPKWTEHLGMIFGDDQELIRFAQELAGYALLAGNPLQVFPIWFGGGFNGKSVTVNTIRSIFGEYAISVAPETFYEANRNAGGATPDLLKFRGTRFVVAIEGKRGRRLDEAFIKQTTGGDRISARGLYQDPEEFDPTHLAIFVTNPKPKISGIEYAIRRRILMVPFTVQIPAEKRVVDYDKVLIEEAPGILNWMVEGLRRYYENGNRITIPAKVQAATDDYLTEMDEIGPFLLEECVLEDAAKTDRAGLYDRYHVWCNDNDVEPVSKERFAAVLKEHQVTDGGKFSNRRLWAGIRVKSKEEKEKDEADGSRQRQL